MAQTKVSLVDLNSNELILDLDGDTTLHSSTDDQIDIKIAGADDFTFTTGAFNVLASSHAVFADSSEAKFGAGTDLQIYHDGTNSFIANKTGALKIATETSGIAITIGHTTSEVTVADNLTVTGNANIGGSLTFADGSIAIADLDIDGGTDIGAAIVDADLFIVDDGAGGTNRKTTASRLLTYAMAGTLSEAAQTNITSLGTLTALTVDDITINASTISDAGDFTLDVEGDIILDSNAAAIKIEDAGTLIGSFTLGSSNFTIKTEVDDKDLIIQGIDGGSTITALTLDMSAAGAATFNNAITSGAVITSGAGLVIADAGNIGSASDTDAIAIAANGQVTLTQTLIGTALDISGDIDVDGTTNLDVVDIDGAVDMASTLQVDGLVTASANMLLNGTTPTLTIGDGGAEDTKIVFDGNAQDFYIALDDSADDLLIGKGSTVGTTAYIHLNSDGDIGFATAPNNVDSGRTLHIKGHNSDGANIRLEGQNDTADTDDMVIQKNDTTGFIKLFGGDTFKVFTSGAERLAIDPDGVVSITTAGNGDNLSLISTDADGSAGPNLRLYRNSSSPDDGNDLGVIDFEGRNDNSQDVVYAQIKSLIVDQTDGTEDGKLEFYHMLAGSLAPSLQLTSTEVVINESSNDLDFRVESNGQANMIFMDGGNNRVHFNGSTGSREVNISGDNTRLLLYSTNNSTGAGQLQFGDQDNEQIGRIMYEHDGNNMTFHTNAAQAMNINSSGRLEVAGAGARAAVIGSTNAGGATLVLDGDSNGDAAGDDYSFITHDTAGRLDIAQDSPSGSNLMRFFTAGASERLRINHDANISTRGEDAPDTTKGFCINQGDADGLILSFKSSDIAHGITNSAETDTFAKFAKNSATNGGLDLFAYSSRTDGEYMRIGLHGNGISDTKSTSGVGALHMFVGNKSGAGIAGLGTNDNIMTIAAYTNTRFIFDAEGDFHADSSSTTFDAYDDAQLVRAYDLSHGKGVIDSKFDKFVAYNHEKLADLKLVGREEDGTPNNMVSITGMQRLHNGAIWQQYEKTERLTQAMFELAKETIGEEKAKAILEKHEVKLLN